MHFSYLQILVLSVLFVAALESLAWGLIIQLVMRVALGVFPSYGRAYTAALIGGVSCYAASFGIGAAVAAFHIGFRFFQLLIIIEIVGLLILTAVYACLLDDGEGVTGSIGMTKGLMIALLQTLISFVLLSPIEQRLHDNPYLVLRLLAHQWPAAPPRYATPEAAKREAVRRYPDLGRPDSALNREFVERYKFYQREKHAFFDDPSWPLKLAEEANRRIHEAR